jgi:hypothetical protein
MDLFEDAQERVRRRSLFVVAGYVVMPEHAHLLLIRPVNSGAIPTHFRKKRGNGWGAARMRWRGMRPVSHFDAYWLPDRREWLVRRKARSRSYETEP